MKMLLVLPMVTGMLFSGAVHALGDAEAGKAKSQVCAACHGPDGNSVNPDFPSLADQVPGYITTQLQLFKSGERKNDIMVGMVAALSEADMMDLDAYYSSQKINVVGIDPKDEELARIGEKIYRGGYQKLNISACMSCHGPSGEGVPRQFPSLTGQHAKYVEAQLHAFKDGTRPHPMMNPIAFLLSNEQIKGLALYVQGLR